MTTSLTLIDPVELLTEKVVSALREAILSGQIKPGARLSVPDLARRLGVSRTPAREALIALERDGLVASRPRYGTVVLNGNAQDLEDLIDIREGLECIAARRAAERMSASEREELQALLRKHSAFLGKHPRSMVGSDLRKHVDLDLAFHACANGGAHNDRLTASLKRIEAQMTVLHNQLSSSPGFAGKAVVMDHTAIADAIIAGNGDKAEAAARKHVQRMRNFYRASRK